MTLEVEGRQQPEEQRARADVEEHRGLGIGVAQRDAGEVLAEGEEPGGGEGEEDGMHA